MLEQFDRRYEQRFDDAGKATDQQLSNLKTAIEQRFADAAKANEVALTATSLALRTGSETTDKALLAAAQAVEKALIIERTSTKDKFDNLDAAFKRIEAQLMVVIPRGEVTEKIDGVSERVKKIEEMAASSAGHSRGLSDLGGWIAAVAMFFVTVVSLFVPHFIK